MTNPVAAVEVSELSIDRGPVRAVDSASFRAEQSEITVLLGPNGAGKTSTVEHLEGYLPRSGGTATVLGLDPASHHRNLTGRVGVMLQNGGIATAIRPLEVLQQYASFFPESLDPVVVLEMVGLSEVRRTPFRRLSGGEQQRLSLGLAIVGRPELLFLDEPTAGVDLEGRDLIRALVRSLASEGTGVLLTTHDLPEAEQLADRVIIMDHGRVVADATPAELMSGSDSDDLRFAASPGLDVVALSSATGAPVVETSPGEYRVEAAPSPAVVAALTAWLAQQNQPLGDMRAGRQRLEDVFRRLTSQPEKHNGDESRPRARGRRRS